MTRPVYRWTLNLLTAGCFIFLYLIFTNRDLPSVSEWVTLDWAQWQGIKTVFISLLLEALPFILLGVLVSSVLHLFVSEDTLRRIVPKHPVPGVLLASLLGVVLPICECGMIPIVRGLIRKGMPVYLGVTYILAAPIINPVTYASTYLAFRTQPEMAYYRIGLAFVVVAVIGWILYFTVKRNPLKQDEHAHSHHDHGHSHSHNHPQKPGGRFLQTFTHASDEFFEMGKYLILGAFITALVQSLVSRQELLSLGDGWLGSHLLMMAFAYIISLCSTSDAFIAASFSGTFSQGALLGFLVFGPMLDFKNTLMMLAVFRNRFVLQLSLLLVIVVLAAVFLLEKSLLEGGFS